MFCFLQPYIQKIPRCLWRIRLRYVCALIGLVILLDILGAFTHILEVPYSDNFAYPYQGDIRPFVEALRRDKRPNAEPINVYNYTFLHDAKDRCADPDFRTLRIVFLVKSATRNFDRREGIRNSWGFGKRFFDVPTRLIFLLGANSQDRDLVKTIDAEARKHKDILQADFVDSYYNNTLKTMMAFEWAVTHCLNARYYMFADDDIYVSVKNVLRFIRNPTSYPDYFKEPSRMAARKREIKDSDWQTNSNELSATVEENSSLPRKINSAARTGLATEDFRQNSSMNFARNANNFKPSDASIETRTNDTVMRRKRQVFDFELPDNARLFAGYVFVSAPHRHKTSKWYVSLKEYPYHLWPPYVTAGAYILSKEALLDMYYASLYTQRFKFDDIFLGIVAKKIGIEPFHCDEFHFYKKEYTKYNYKYVITSHGYDNPKELVAVWQEQKSLGNA